MFHSEPGTAPRVEIIAAATFEDAVRVAPHHLLACGIPSSAVAGWAETERNACNVAIGPGTYLLTSRLEDLCRLLARPAGGNMSDIVFRTIKLYELTSETIDAFLRNELLSVSGDVRLPATDREHLNRARRLIVTRYAEKLTICQIARAAGIGRAKLIRGFRELYGCSVHEMISSRRLQVAATSLRATRQPVSRIAFESGYHSSAAFARAFAKHYGSSPSTFRNEG
ncbi:AraC family transcriptional regulator [Sphingomonas sp. BIUV-7]|uniref:AraC family transcriptional regulator n=1 Tax=Sphingomonas natans TaxID=3063330 RepID=A0ABT8Y8Q9_9SPHN|nr:AraC family transcriptional regulator [Sphingomonas sp. BIUV-7]MDO6414710.1 AraC family transcriptional regulator [Sphingomonas sp. BIUV-7]